MSISFKKKTSIHTYFHLLPPKTDLDHKWDDNVVPILYLPKNNPKREPTVTDHDLSHQLQNNSGHSTTTIMLPFLATKETTTQISAALSPPIINHNTIVTPI